MKLITQILHPYEQQLGEDYHTYHHHAQRVYAYAITLLLLRESKKLAIAAAFHDLDVWVSGTMDYLPGSSQLAKEYLATRDFGLLPDEINYIIVNHHRIHPVRDHQEAEAFRKADLIDLTAGHIRFNLPESIISETERLFPRLKFTRRMIRKSLGYAATHPFRPFPMLRW